MGLPKNYNAVEDAINAVVRGKTIAEQTTVDGYAAAIENAINALEYKDADYTKVDAAIDKANALNKNDYKDFSGVEAASRLLSVVKILYGAVQTFFLETKPWMEETLTMRP